jgi:hypothetical protein
VVRDLLGSWLEFLLLVLILRLGMWAVDLVVPYHLGFHMMVGLLELF